MSAKRYWNYRVIEFVEPATEQAWRAIHEVHYEDDKPVSYVERHACVVWDVDEDKGAPFTIIDQMSTALLKPVLVERDFDTKDGSIKSEIAP